MKLNTGESLSIAGIVGDDVTVGYSYVTLSGNSPTGIKNGTLANFKNFVDIIPDSPVTVNALTVSSPTNETITLLKKTSAGYEPLARGIISAGKGMSLEGGKFVFANGDLPIEQGSPRFIKNKVLFLGSSISGSVYGATTARNWEMSSGCWGFWFMASLGGVIKGFINKGISGNDTNQMVERYKMDVEANYSEFGTLMFEPGPNDYSDDAITLQNIKDNITYIVTSALNAGKRVVVISPTPAAGLTDDQQAKRGMVLSWLMNQYWDNFYVVNSDEILLDKATNVTLPEMYIPTSIEPNNVHLSNAGAQALGRHVANAVRELFGDFSITMPPNAGNQYLSNPYLGGSNASGTNNFYTGTLVTGTGPHAVSVGIDSGTFSSVAVSSPTYTGEEDIPTGGLVVTATGAVADMARVAVLFGSNFDGSGGTTANGRWDTNLAVSTAYKHGDHGQLAAYPTGILKCIVPGTTAGTLPTLTDEYNYGSIVVSNTAKFIWIKKIADGDKFVAEVELEVLALTGGLAFDAQCYFIRSNLTLGETWGAIRFPAYDISPTIGQGLPSKYVPRKLTLRSGEMTIGNPGVAHRYTGIKLRMVLTAGGSATVLFKKANIIKV